VKIALLWPDYWPYIRRGTERMVYDIARHLVERGDTVHVLASKPGRGSVSVSERLTIHRLAQRDHPLLRYYTTRLGRLVFRFDTHGFSVIPHLLRERYDLIHAFSYLYGPALHLARAVRGTPTVYHVVMIPPYWPRALDRRLVELCLALGGPTRVFSRFCGRYVEEHFGVECEVVPPTVDAETFRPVGQKDPSHPKILYTADLVQVPKGPHVLALAFNKIHRACPEAVLQLAGPVGSDPAGVKNLLHLVEPQARGAVEVVGPGALADLPRLYSEAAVTVLPSLDEPFGMVLTESLSCGTPVVGSDSGAIPEIITDPSVGALFHRTDADLTGSASRLAEAVVAVLDLARDPMTVRRCRDHARRWTWSEIDHDFDRLQSRALTRTQARIRGFA
jgi:phosphatidyl-myo-inositol alpha-mannosyltransferase